MYMFFLRQSLQASRILCEIIFHSILLDTFTENLKYLKLSFIILVPLNWHLTKLKLLSLLNLFPIHKI